ncbi:MAG: FAD-dependent oxidoreductase [Acidipropionibacterium sp.]|nr:FAD-dependent oxidoreductase [Acidipropionibacterium sp.]
MIGSNRICSLSEAREALERTHLAAVALARPFLADPDVVAGPLAGRTVIPCIGCNEECIDHSMTGRPISCLVNPRVGREAHTPLPSAPTEQPRRLAVVGAGPAGLVGAVDAARRGHRVTLFEAGSEVGGQLRLAGLVSGKSDYLAAARAMAKRFVELGGELVLNRRVEVEELAGFDAAVLATGVRPRRIEIDTDGSCTVLGYAEALEMAAGSGPGAGGGAGVSGPDVAAGIGAQPLRPGDTERPFGEVLVIGGGGVAVDVGATLAPASSGMTLIRRGSRRFAAGTSPSTRWIGLGELRRAGARMWNNARLVRVRDGVATVEVQVPPAHSSARSAVGAAGSATPVAPAGHGPQIRADGEVELREVPVDTLIVAVGSDPCVLPGKLSIPHRIVGGAKDAGGLNAARSTREALEAVRELV